MRQRFRVREDQSISSLRAARFRRPISEDRGLGCGRVRALSDELRAPLLGRSARPTNGAHVCAPSFHSTPASPARQNSPKALERTTLLRRPGLRGLPLLAPFEHHRRTNLVGFHELLRILIELFFVFRHAEIVRFASVCGTRRRLWVDVHSTDRAIQTFIRLGAEFRVERV